MIKVGILGASGYTANELVRILLGHKNAQIVWLGSQSHAGKPYYQSYQNFFKIFDLACVDSGELERLCEQIDVLFCATPHNFCARVLSAKILESVKVIDLSADFRLRDEEVFKRYYGSAHANPTLLAQSVYGLCELNREQIKAARLVANPGCYPTCSILSLAPLLAHDLIDPRSIIIDAKSGVSGAGRKAVQDSLYCEVNESFKAYAIGTHRHTPEIEQGLSDIAAKSSAESKAMAESSAQTSARNPNMAESSIESNTLDSSNNARGSITLSFTPHLVPMNRGILATSYASLAESKASVLDSAALREIYQEFYAREHFVRILEPGLSAQTRWVKGSNFIDIAPFIDTRTNRVIITAAIDNLIKGASGQAVQNMNIMFGLPESSALESAPIFP